MAAFTYVRGSLVAWQADPAVTADEFWKLDWQLRNALNAVDGGTWAPTAVITIGGDGMTITGQFNASNVGSMVVQGDLEVDGGTLSLIGSVFDADAASTFAVDCDADFNGQANFLGIAEFADKLNVLSGCDFSVKTGGTFTIETGVTAQSDSAITLNKALIRNSSEGRSRSTSRSLKSTNTNQTAGVEYDYIEMNVSGAGAITLTLKIATAPVPTEGEKIFVRKIGAGAGGLTVQNEGSGSAIATVVGANVANLIVIFEATSNKWRLFGGAGTYTEGADAA